MLAYCGQFTQLTYSNYFQIFLTIKAMVQHRHKAYDIFRVKEKLKLSVVISIFPNYFKGQALLRITSDRAKSGLQFVNE
ncbi:hypothetical protein BCU17_21535 [Vibrio splendidus]|uniref:Uncharacterized protein n=1 Tax=Vibrio splendidus TaxID=29497 RepID=A0A2N7F9U0_VIBSP|nr:hypothetical protein BCU17_21535 [Vibrio splendidus]